jgi:hypothetical protein
VSPSRSSPGSLRDLPAAKIGTCLPHARFFTGAGSRFARKPACAGCVIADVCPSAFNAENAWAERQQRRRTSGPMAKKTEAAPAPENKPVSSASARPVGEPVVAFLQETSAPRATPSCRAGASPTHRGDHRLDRAQPRHRSPRSPGSASSSSSPASVSGSGTISPDTLYAEGQRRYVGETL